MDILANTTDAVQHNESGLHDLRLLKGMWPYMRRHRKPLFISLLLLPGIAAMEIAQTYTIRYAIDNPIKQGNWPELLIYAAIFPLCMAINFRLRYWQMNISQQTGQHIIRDIRVELYRHFQSLSPRFYNKHPQGKLLTRLTADIENLNEMLASGGLAILADLAMVVGAFIGMLWMNWQLALVTVGSMIALLFLMDIFRSRSRRAYDEIRVHAARMNGFLQESLNGMELVQLYRREQPSAEHYARLNERTMKSGKSSIFYSTSFNAVVDFMTTITLALLLGFGAWQARQGALTIGKLVGFFMFTRKMFEPIEDISEKYSVLQSGLASIDKVMALFSEQPEIVNQPKPAVASPEIKIKGEIVFDGVDFGYTSEKLILNKLDLRIHSGESIAIVGPSGAGKTTLLKLLMRFYDVTGGSIRLDGYDLRDWDVHTLRRNIISIQQDDFLFSRSIAENIALAPADTLTDPAVRHRLQHALETSHAHRVVARFNDGLDHVLQARGQDLSSGERQLLLFARAIYHDPAILILDEATSAVDPVNENLVQSAMEDVMRGRTVLIVAHRLSTVRQSDRILVMEKGRFIQQGTHEELITQPGLYQQLCQAQEMLSHA